MSEFKSGLNVRDFLTMDLFLGCLRIENAAAGKTEEMKGLERRWLLGRETSTRKSLKSIVYIHLLVFSFTHLLIFSSSSHR